MDHDVDGRSSVVRVTRQIAIDRREIVEQFIRSSGPGGQNVNKVSTAVCLRFDLANSGSLPDAVKDRLIGCAGRRMTRDGVLVIKAGRFRSLQKNRRDALDRLIALIASASKRPTVRRPTQRTRALVRHRLDAKRRRSMTKQSRGRVGDRSQ